MPRDAFVSHASVDAGLALAICEGLEKRGLTCWIAPRDVRSEGTYGTEIIRGLRECTTFLIVLTAASSESQQVEREAERASHYQKRIIPLSVGGGEPGERLEFYTAGRQRVACSTTIDDTFLDRLAAVIRGDQSPVSEVQPARPRSRGFPRAAYAGLGGLVAIAVLAAWMSGVLNRPSGPAANQPENRPVSPPPSQPAAEPSKPPETTAARDNQVPPVAKGPEQKAPEQKARGAAASPPVSEKGKSTASTIPPAPSAAPRSNDPPPRPSEPAPLVVNGRTLRFVAVPRGTFMMGCTPGDEECSEDEKGLKELTVPAFQMSATEVTQAFWEATMGGNPSDFSGPQQPVENVSWQEATAFAARLTQRGDGFTYRLPREGEWEYAARANGPPPEPLSSVAWFGLLATAGGDAKPREVAKKRPNAWGLFDMLGNVAEWCEDWFSPNHQRVVRGGAWTDSATSLRFSARGKATPGTRTYAIGVRLVRTPASP